MKIFSLADIAGESVSHDPQITKKMLIRDGELPHLTKFAQLRMTPGQIAHAHSHTDEYELFLVEAGEGSMAVDGEEYHLSAGTCVVFDPEEIHQIVNTGKDDLVMTYLGVRV